MGMMSKMMEGGEGRGGMPGTMSKMMEVGDETGMPMMASKMLTMMPECAEMTAQVSLTFRWRSTLISAADWSTVDA